MAGNPPIASGLIPSNSASATWPMPQGGWIMSTPETAHSDKGAPRSSPRKGKLTRQKPLLKMREVRALRIRLQPSGQVRELALFNLAIDSEPRGCNLVAVKVGDAAVAGQVRSRTIAIQRKTGRPVQFEITEQTREPVAALIRCQDRNSGDDLFPDLFPSRSGNSRHLSTRQHARLVRRWPAPGGHGRRLPMGKL
jgi:hypothetical protein